MQPSSLSPQTLYRGLYVRVSQKLRVDPSYVSRVARGGRYSQPVESALRNEIEQHGRMRHGQGSSVETVLEDYNLLRRCFFMLAEENIHHLETPLLIHDLAQLGVVLDLQSQSAVKPLPSLRF
jgi:hypothetical protein